MKGCDLRNIKVIEEIFFLLVWMVFKRWLFSLFKVGIIKDLVVKFDFIDCGVVVSSVVFCVFFLGL